MAIVRWDPFKLMRWPEMWDEDDLVPASGTASGLDLYETEDEVVVKASVPGVSEDAVEITFEKGVLWIQAEEVEEQDEGKKYYRKATRNFSYKVAVPGDIDMSDDPRAKIENGVVSVTFKKAEKAKPKKITIQSAGK